MAARAGAGACGLVPQQSEGGERQEDRGQHQEYVGEGHHSGGGVPKAMLLIGIIASIEPTRRQICGQSSSWYRRAHARGRPAVLRVRAPDRHCARRAPPRGPGCRRRARDRGYRGRRRAVPGVLLGDLAETHPVRPRRRPRSIPDRPRRRHRRTHLPRGLSQSADPVSSSAPRPSSATAGNSRRAPADCRRGARPRGHGPRTRPRARGRGSRRRCPAR